MYTFLSEMDGILSEQYFTYHLGKALEPISFHPIRIHLRSFSAVVAEDVNYPINTLKRK